jgi:hypothetical protein
MRVSGNSQHVQDLVDLTVFVATTVVVTHECLIGVVDKFSSQ